MIEGRAFVSDAFIRQRFEERYQIGRFSRRQTNHSNVGVLGAERAAAVVVKLYNVIQRKARAVVEVRSSEFHIPQAGGLKSPVHIQSFIRPEVG